VYFTMGRTCPPAHGRVWQYITMGRDMPPAHWRVSLYFTRYDTRCYFNVRSKADISQLNLPHGSLIYRTELNLPIYQSTMGRDMPPAHRKISPKQKFFVLRSLTRACRLFFFSVCSLKCLCCVSVVVCLSLCIYLFAVCGK